MSHDALWYAATAIAPAVRICSLSHIEGPATPQQADIEHLIEQCTPHPPLLLLQWQLSIVHVAVRVAVPVRNNGVLWHLAHIHAEAVLKGVWQRGVEALDKRHAVPWLNKPA